MVFIFRILIISLVFLWMPALLADYITRFGLEVMKGSDIIIQGVVVQTIPIGRGGGEIVHFRVESVYQGKIEVSKTIPLFYLTSPLTLDEQWVIFAAYLPSKHAFRSLGEFSIKQKDGTAKLETFKKILALELIPDMEKKKQAYLDYCLDSLVHPNTWIRLHTFTEWQHITNKHSSLLTLALVDRLQKLYDEIPETYIRDTIKKEIIRIKQMSQNKKTIDSANIDPISWQHLITKTEKHFLESTDHSQKFAAIQTSGFLVCKKSRKLLLQALQDKSEHVRAYAAFYLGFHKDAEVIRPLLEVLRTDDYLRVRKNAIISLGRLHATEAIPEITKYLETPYTRWHAMEALKKLSSVTKIK